MLRFISDAEVLEHHCDGQNFLLCLCFVKDWERVTSRTCAKSVSHAKCTTSLLLGGTWTLKNTAGPGAIRNCHKGRTESAISTCHSEQNSELLGDQKVVEEGERLRHLTHEKRNHDRTFYCRGIDIAYSQGIFVLFWRCRRRLGFPPSFRQC